MVGEAGKMVRWTVLNDERMFGEADKMIRGIILNDERPSASEGREIDTSLPNRAGTRY